MTDKTFLRFDLHFEPPIEGLFYATTRFEHGLEDLSPLFLQYEVLFRENERQQFESQGSWGSDGWADLTDSYAAWKLAEVGPKPIGNLYGHLFAGMTGGEGYEAEISPTHAAFGLGSGPALDYGRFFAERRPVIAFPGHETRRWQRAAHQWLLQASREWAAAAAGTTGRAGRLQKVIR